MADPLPSHVPLVPAAPAQAQKPAPTAESAVSAQPAADHPALEAARAAISQRFRRIGTGLSSQTLESAVRAFLLRTTP